MVKHATVVQPASRTSLLTNTHFKGYDICMNPYVGCQFGCRYCYVRFFVTDDARAEKEERPSLDWGEFVRTRDFMADKLPKELQGHTSQYPLNKDGTIDKSQRVHPKIGFLRLPIGKVPVYDDKGKIAKRAQAYRELHISKSRLVIGTMTDPYQPIERKKRITRTALELLKSAPFPLNKIGIFTRSPLVLDDLELIASLPRIRIHFSITPYDTKTIHMIEPIAVRTDRRFEVIKKLKEAGIRIHVNVAPAIPYLSDGLTEEFAQKLAEAKVDEFFVDPMQAYDQSFEATKAALQHDPRWPAIEGTMQNAESYDAWKEQFEKRWTKAWKQHGHPEARPIWCDHINHVWRNMNTGQDMDTNRYDDEDPT